MRTQEQASSILHMGQEETRVELKHIAHFVLLQDIHQSHEMLIRWLALQLKAGTELSLEACGKLGICHSCRQGKYSTMCFFSYLSLSMNQIWIAKK